MPPYVTGLCSVQNITQAPRSDWCVSIGAGEAAAQFDQFFIPCKSEDACGLVLDHLKQLAAAEGADAVPSEPQ